MLSGDSRVVIWRGSFCDKQEFMLCCGVCRVGGIMTLRWMKMDLSDVWSFVRFYISLLELVMIDRLFVIFL